MQGKYYFRSPDTDASECMSQERDVQEMLEFLGIDSVERLFDDIPEQVKIDGLNLPEGLYEMEVKRHLEKILARNISLDEIPSFLGSGAYDFYIPSAVGAIVSRSEFYSSYTPYQPETSQGMLQSMFEYQSMMAELTGMEAVNNSMYDWATGLGEAVLMAARLKRGKEFIVPRAIPKDRASVLRNYVKGAGIRIIEVGFDKDTGQLDLDDLKSKITHDTIGAYFETPNMFGAFEEGLDEIRQLTDGTIMAVGVNPLSLAVARPPGEYDADIVIGEGQMFGNPINYGGPHLGFLACKKKFVRKIPGRIVGYTHDMEGQQAFCMTLQTREQHIRREKATSNICSNEALTTLAAAVYMALKGGRGLQELAIEVMEKSKRLAGRLSEIDGITSPMFKSYYFNEFTAQLPLPADEVFKTLAGKAIIGGKPIIEFGELKNSMVLSVTDKTTDDDIEKLAIALGDTLGVI